MSSTESIASVQAAKLALQAELCAENRDWHSADEFFRKALSLDASLSIRIAYGVCLGEQERYFEAICQFTSVLDGSDPSAIRIVCHNLASIYREVGDNDLARRFQWRAMLMQDYSDAGDLLGLANDALADRHPEVAASLVMTAREMERGETDERSDGDLIATTGLVRAALNSTEEGLVTVFAAYRCHQAKGDCRGMGVDLLNMAQLFGKVGRFRAERACLVRAIRCFEQSPAPHSYQKAKQQLDQFDQLRTVRSFDARWN